MGGTQPLLEISQSQWRGTGNLRDHRLRVWPERVELSRPKVLEGEVETLPMADVRRVSVKRRQLLWSDLLVEGGDRVLRIYPVNSTDAAHARDLIDQRAQEARGG